MSHDMARPGSASGVTESGALQIDADVDNSRRKFLTAATAGMAGVGVVAALTPFVQSWKPSERARALGAPIEIDLSKVEPGQMVTATWRKQQIYVVKRTAAMLGTLAAHSDLLKDAVSAESDQPEYAKNDKRSRQDDLLVLVGTCTHLGCLPKQRFTPGDAEVMPNWPGGFFCPCHGSKFDLAGRVFKGSPASLNLRVPPYYLSADARTVVVGLDDAPKKGAA